MNSTVIERIKKLLSLAQSDNANERDAALAKAQRIATENEVDLALLDLSDVGVVKEEELVEDKFSIGRRLDPHKRFVAAVVAKVCNVQAIYWSGNGGRQISFLGKKSDVAFAVWLYSFLLDEYVRRWNYTRKSLDLPADHRNTFYLGVQRGQLAKIEEEKQAAAREAILGRAQTDAAQAGVDVETKRAEYAGKYQLAMVNDAARVDAFKRKLHPRLGTIRYSSTRVRSNDTYSTGFSHGRSIGLNRPLNA